MPRTVWNQERTNVLENQENKLVEAIMPTLTLDQIVEKARKHRVTPEERRAQRISLIMGLRSKNSTLTREEVASFLDSNEGHQTLPAKKVARRRRKSR